jgi:ATP-dependent helicase/nuclease subunit A
MSGPATAPRTDEPQIAASSPEDNVFVAANAGAGKTTTLVTRVARLLLAGARPEAILCVTYTKAAASEMQRRLYEELGEWSISEDRKLKEALARIGENPNRPLSEARALFARALETPGGLKIQTIHAFCERLLRRFPLEAGVTPSFEVLDEQGASEIAAASRETLAEAALADPEGPIAQAFTRFSVDLDYQAFEAMFKGFDLNREKLSAYLARAGDYVSDVWTKLGFAGSTTPEIVAAEAIAATDWSAWFVAAKALAVGGKTDQELGRKMQALAEAARADEGRAFEEVIEPFFTTQGPRPPKARLATKTIDPATVKWLSEEQARLEAAREKVRAATIAADTVDALFLGLAYCSIYAGEKERRRVLDFADLIARTRELLTVRADATWVLFKLDGGVDHILLDEAQDTAPEQWEIIRPLTDEFFAGAGAAERARTLFVVGDEKQSIYSFQGAAPERLRREALAYAAQLRAADLPFAAVPLHDSWRSTPEILRFVDEVFATPESIEALTTDPDGEPIEHRALRGPGGCVELWPWMKDERRTLEQAWDAPLDAEPEESARKALARRIAAEVNRLVRDGDAVFDKTTRKWRAAGPGDVLILVRKRDPLFEEIIRALKKARLPVAGADRLLLSEHVVFQDMMALARFCLAPEDDLTLACLLRSPFCEVDEESLYQLAYGREFSLWSALQKRSSERRAWGRAHDFLDWARAEAQARAPFDFFTRVLQHSDPERRTQRQRILTRLGREAEDALDEMLAAVAAAEKRGAHDLETLVARLALTEVEVKRELEAARGEVRIMTVHGAKGLEAPIVILPDTTAVAVNRMAPLIETPDGGFVWAPRKRDDCQYSGAARQAAVDRAARENRRLLYVALTRARDRLVVCGRVAANRSDPEPGSWYALVEQGFERPDIAAETRAIEKGSFAFRRFGPDPLRLTLPPPQLPLARVIPSWAETAATPERGARWASPSNISEAAKAAAPSPLSERAGLGRFRRGELVHKLFEVLPEIEPERRREAAERLLSREPDLTPDQRTEMIEAAFAVLDDKRFAEVFGPGSRAEAAVAGTAPDLPEGLSISGRLDRLVISPERVLVADYKTNRPAPERIEDADPAYLEQMAVYVAVLRALYSDRPVEAALIWTDGPRLMPLPRDVIEDTLARIRLSS